MKILMGSHPAFGCVVALCCVFGVGRLKCFSFVGAVRGWGRRTVSWLCSARVLRLVAAYWAMIGCGGGGSVRVVGAVALEVFAVMCRAAGRVCQRVSWGGVG